MIGLRRSRGLGDVLLRKRPAADRVALVLVAAAALLVGLSLLTRYLAYRREVASPGIAPPAWLAFFDVSSEGNLPTWFTVAVMVATGCAALGAAAVWRPSAPRAGWFFMALAAVLLAFSLDELASLHERLLEFDSVLPAGSALHFTWTVPGVALAAAVVGGLLLGARAVGRRTRRRLALALAVFFAGALAMEVFSGQVLRADGHRAAYVLVTAVEEFLEMVGVVLALRAVLSAVRVRTDADGWVLTPDLPT